MFTEEQLKNPENEYKNATRWWLAEGFHTDETLLNELKLLDEAGFGAVEFLALEEPGADSKRYGWGAEEWVHDSQLIFRETTRRGLGVSATCGTNWANCNLTGITPDDRAAAKELDYCLEILEAGEHRDGPIPKCRIPMQNVHRQELIAVVSLRFAGEREETETTGEKRMRRLLDRESAAVLTGLVREDQLSYTAPDDGKYFLFYFYIHGTGQTAGPSADVSYTVNYMDRYGIDAFKEYWDREVLTPDLRETIRTNGHAMMYMDSLELSTFCRAGQFWGYTLLEEFRKRRGYDLTPYLPFIVKPAGFRFYDFIYRYHSGDNEWDRKLRFDLYETMTDLYMENMMRPMQEWCHGHGMELRAEISYGLPFELSRPGKYTDGIETESLEFCSQIDSYRGLAGPAHVYNRVYSSETGASRLNFMMGLDFYTQIIFTQFAAGVTRTVLHGYSSIRGSEEATEWPGHEGMWPIYSERFGERQPAYPYYPDWNRMIARFQKILRSGRPRMDLAILRMDYNYYNLHHVMNSRWEKRFYEHEGMRGHKGQYWQDMTLQDHGFTWDYFAPQLLSEDFMTADPSEGRIVLQEDGPAYQAIILYQDVLPLEAAGKLLKLAEEGLPVIFVDHAEELLRPTGINTCYEKAADRTPSLGEADEELAELIRKIKALPNVREVPDPADTYHALLELGVHPRTEFADPCEKVLTLTRQDGDTTYIYAYNMQYTDTEPIKVSIRVPVKGRVFCIDCWSGRINEIADAVAEKESLLIPVCLAPGQAVIYAVEKQLRPVRMTHCIEGKAKVLRVDGEQIAHAFESGLLLFEGSDGSIEAVNAKVPSGIELPRWNLTVEDWNEGERREILEDRGLGYTTKEVYYETVKSPVEVGETALKSWKELKEVGPEVSGIGHYETVFELPEDFDRDCGAVFYAKNVCKCAAAVGVNGHQPVLMDLDLLEKDITDELVPGQNTLRVDVCSSLKNRLLQRGYYEKSEAVSGVLRNKASNSFTLEEDEDEPRELTAIVQLNKEPIDYGMIGQAGIRFYRKLKL